MDTDESLRESPKLGFDALRIVGFDGIVIPEVHCDESLAVVQRDKDFAWSVLPYGRGAEETTDWSDPRELDRFSEERRITLIPKSLKAFPEVVVLYVTDELLTEASYSISDRFEDHDLEWISLADTTPSVRVCCVTHNLAIRFMNYLSSQVLKKLDAQLIGARRNGGCGPGDDFRRLANLALDAARDSRLTERVYLRLGVADFCAEGMERLLRLFTRVSVKCPAWSKDIFLHQVLQYAELTRSVAIFESSASGLQSASMQSALDSNVKRILHYAETVRRKFLSDNSSNVAYDAAEMIRREYPSEPQLSNLDMESFLNLKNRASSDHFYITSYEVIMLARKPVFYYPEVTTDASSGTLLHVRQLRLAHHSMGPNSWNLDLDACEVNATSGVFL